MKKFKLARMDILGKLLLDELFDEDIQDHPEYNNVSCRFINNSLSKEEQKQNVQIVFSEIVENIEDTEINSKDENVDIPA